MELKIPNTEALRLIEESIAEGKEVLLRVKGNSMSPLLLDNIDVVTLTPFHPDNLKTGDVILFRYQEGFVLHRIISIDGSEIVAKGDVSARLEVIGYSDVVALAKTPEIGSVRKILRSARILLSRIRAFYCEVIAHCRSL